MRLKLMPVCPFGGGSVLTPPTLSRRNPAARSLVPERFKGESVRPLAPSATPRGVLSRRPLHPIPLATTDVYIVVGGGWASSVKNAYGWSWLYLYRNYNNAC